MFDYHFCPSKWTPSLLKRVSNKNHRGVFSLHVLRLREIQTNYVSRVTSVPVDLFRLWGLLIDDELNDIVIMKKWLGDSDTGNLCTIEWTSPIADFPTWTFNNNIIQQFSFFVTFNCWKKPDMWILKTFWCKVFVITGLQFSNNIE